MAEAPDAAGGGDPVRVERHGRVAHVVLDRPHRLNAIDGGSLDLLGVVVGDLDGDDGVGAIVIRGEGRAFCAGADLEVMDRLAGDPDGFARFLARWHAVFDLVEDASTPTIAAVHGLALAGGFELLQVCDLVVAADDARLGDQHARYGLFPAGGSVQRLPRLIGERRAKWLLYSGEWITPAEAREAGLVNEVVPPGEVVPRAHRMAELLARRSPLATARIKASLHAGRGSDTRTALARERSTALEHMLSGDARAGLDAFQSRTDPQFTGR